MHEQITALLARLRAERATAETNARFGLYSRYRPATMRALGVVLLPEAITDGWYAADCPPRLDAKLAGVSCRDRFAWRVSRLLRGTA